MTSRNPKTGGRIPPQGRAPTAPGVGRNARRHDLERPATPGLSNSDLQHGDVQELEQAQAVAPRAGAKRVQQPGRNPTQRRTSPGPSTLGQGLAVPSPIDFAKQRIGGTLTQGGAGQTKEVFDFSAWAPLLRRLISSPGAGGTLTRAYIQRLSDIQRKPVVRSASIDVSELDDALEEAIG
jgi:hypothetical protein